MADKIRIPRPDGRYVFDRHIIDYIARVRGSIEAKRRTRRFTEITDEEHAIFYLSEQVRQWYLRWKRIKREKTVVEYSDDCQELAKDYRTAVLKYEVILDVLMRHGCTSKEPYEIEKYLKDLGGPQTGR